MLAVRTTGTLGRPCLRCRCVFAAPRRGQPPRHLADLSAQQRAEAVAALGEKPLRARQLSRHYFARLSVDAPSMTDIPAALPRRPGGRAAAAAADRGPRAELRRRRHQEVAVAGARRHAAGKRDDALPGPCHGLRVQPGGLRDGVPVLRHRPGRPAAQPVHGGDRRAGPLRRPPPSGRGAAGPAAAGCRTWCSWGWASRWRTTGGWWTRCTGSPIRRPRASASRSGRSRCRRSGWCPRSASWPTRGLAVALAVSLHTPDDELRDTLVPVNSRWKVAEVLAPPPGLRRTAPGGGCRSSTP